MTAKNELIIDGKKLKQVRVERKVSAAQLKEILGNGTTVENVYAWERGHQPLSMAMRKKVLDWITDPKALDKKEPAKITRTNGVPVPDENYKEKYYTLLEKYTALLEKK